MAAEICPKPPPGAETHVRTLESYGLWFVIAGFTIAFLACIGLMLVGRSIKNPHMVQGGAVGLVAVFIIAIVFLAFPGILSSMLGKGCVQTL